ncbi:AfsR/SARP family transcriptional regulator [Catenulispora yoronensis]|uniref:AfsR/SARP family transcriptional regulator n=1 Tax=Catenulispora yoronensis TaxID=450799 RepID=UPI0031E1700D
MRFQLLGPLGACRANGPLPLGTSKQRRLLTALLLDANRSVPIDRLIASVWDDDPPASAIANIRTYVSRLRGLLVDDRGNERITRRGTGYAVDVADEELDLAEFRALAREGRAAAATGDVERAAAVLGAALAVWRGEPAEDLPPSDFLRRRLEPLAEERLTVVEEWAEARRRAGGDPRLVADLRYLVEDHPLRERLWYELVLALYRRGDAPGALHAYAQARKALIDELGIEPGPDLARLHQAVLTRDPSLEAPVRDLGRPGTSGERSAGQPSGQAAGPLPKRLPERLSESRRALVIVVVGEADPADLGEVLSRLGGGGPGVDVHRIPHAGPRPRRRH